MKKSIILIMLMLLAVFSFSCADQTYEGTAIMAGNAVVLDYGESGFSLFETPLNKTLTLTNKDFEALKITLYSENGKSVTLSAAKEETAKAHGIGSNPSAVEIEADKVKKAYALSEKGLYQLLSSECESIILVNNVTISSALTIERPLSVLASAKLIVEDDIHYITDKEGTLKLEGNIMAKGFACRAPLSHVEIPHELINEQSLICINALSVNGTDIQTNIRVAQNADELRLLASKPAYFAPEKETIVVRGFSPDEDITVSFPCSISFESCSPNGHIKIETEESGEINLKGEFTYKDIKINAPNCTVNWDNPCTLYEAAKSFEATSLNGYKLSEYKLDKKSNGKILSAKMVADGALITDDIQWKVKGNTLTATVDGIAAPSALKNATLVFESENCTKISTDKASRGETSGIDLLDPLGAYVTVKGEDGNTKKYRIVTKVQSKLPVVVIETENNAEIESRDEYINATVSVESDFSDGLASEKNTSVQIKGRGNSTWYYSNKKPYKIKYDKDVSLLGLNKGKEWVLLANYNDKTLIRNYVALESAKVLTNMDCYATQYPVDVYLNGEYIGVYSLGEQIETGDDRIQLIGDATSVDTGFLMEIGGKAEFDGYNTFTTSYMQCVEILEPSGTSLTEKNKEYIVDYMLRTDNAVQKLRGYEDYIDIDSLIDWLIITEVSFNSDGAMRRSVFFKKDHGEKLEFGPVWDFDIAYGNSNTDFDNYEAWCCLATNYNYVYNNWICRLMEDEAFVAKLTARWNEVKNRLRTTSLEAIDYAVSIIEHSADANYEKWDVLDSLVGMQPDWMIEYDTYEENVEYLKTFINNRMYWIDSQLNGQE